MEPGWVAVCSYLRDETLSRDPVGLSPILGHGLQAFRPRERSAYAP